MLSSDQVYSHVKRICEKLAMPIELQDTLVVSGNRVSVPKAYVTQVKESLEGIL